MSRPDSAVPRARTLIELGRHDEAVRLLGAHLATEPEDVAALCLTGQAELALGHPYPAVLAARAATAVHPESEWAWRLQALALVRLNEYDEARAAADRAVAVAPQVYQPHAARAEVYTAIGDTDQAGESAKKAIELAPNVASNWVVSGNVELRRRRLRRARMDFQKALSIDPSSATARNNLAVSDMRRRRLGRAVKGFLATARANPRSDLAIHNLRAVLNYGFGIMTILVWVASAVARAQVNDNGGLDPSARTVIACAAVSPLLAALLGLEYLRRTLAGAFGALMRDVLRSTWRVGAAIVLLVTALIAMLVAAALPAHSVEPMLLLASAAAFGALVTIPRRLR